ncbi:MAG: hypothetical protein D6714_12015 [Bacteroidetes bacterium]|nr:MAG: hypothetical protein D6714_12015 [Bacteroidota bacterium]
MCKNEGNLSCIYLLGMVVRKRGAFLEILFKGIGSEAPAPDYYTFVCFSYTFFADSVLFVLSMFFIRNIVWYCLTFAPHQERNARKVVRCVL